MINFGEGSCTSRSSCCCSCSFCDRGKTKSTLRVKTKPGHLVGQVTNTVRNPILDVSVRAAGML